MTNPKTENDEEGTVAEGAESTEAVDNSGPAVPAHSDADAVAADAEAQVN